MTGGGFSVDAFGVFTSFDQKYMLCILRWEGKNHFLFFELVDLYIHRGGGRVFLLA